MKPILAINLSSCSPQEAEEVLRNCKGHPITQDYHVFITTDSIKLTVLNGDEVKEMTVEEFKKAIE